MDILVIGGGGREHAIIKMLKASPSVGRLYAAPGNGGIASEAECTGIAATDMEGIKRFVKETKVDFAAVIPDDPLALGMVDMLEEMGIPCFGPNRAAAIIEGSKAFSKRLMEKYDIPTAKCRIFDSYADALGYVESQKPPMVIKADGLALGKGVIIAFTEAEAKAALKSMMLDGKFGASGNTVVIEEFLTGPEVSVLALTDGNDVFLLPSSMDHKRALDGDLGKNTGGMGAIAPNPYFTDEMKKRCMDEIILPTIAAMKAEGRTFRGCLYFGLMLTADGPKVIEYNCRFGDPETQAVLPLVEADLASVMRLISLGKLAEADIRVKNAYSCCVVLASGGYPDAYEKGKTISIGEMEEDTTVFHAGTKLTDGGYITSGGRVIGVTAVRESLAEAVKAAYRGADRIHFEGMYRRSDIGKRALETRGES